MTMEKRHAIALAIEKQYGDGHRSFELREAVSDALLKAREDEKTRCLDILAAEREWSGDIDIAVERIRNDREPRKIPGWNADSED